MDTTKVTDIIKRIKVDGGMGYYSNKFLDVDEAYGIVNEEVMIIGKVEEGDWGLNELILYNEPKKIAPNVLFYNPDEKPVKILNDLQQKKEFLIVNQKRRRNAVEKYKGFIDNMVEKVNGKSPKGILFKKWFRKALYNGAATLFDNEEE